MGRQIINLVTETEGLTLVGAAEHSDNPTVGQDAGEVAGIGTLGVNISAGLDDALAGKDADVIIIGAGLSGLSAAVEMGRSGLKVLVVDMNSVAGGHAMLADALSG